MFPPRLVHRQRFSFAPSRQIRSLVKRVELVENYENVGNEEGEKYGIDAAIRLVRANAIEENERKLHLKIAKTHTSCANEKGFNYYAR